MTNYPSHVAAPERPLKTYTLRSWAAYPLIVASLALAASLAVLFGALSSGPHSQWWWVAVAVFAALAIGALTGLQPYLVPGGRGELRLFWDRIELRAETSTMWFPLATVRVRTTARGAPCAYRLTPRTTLQSKTHIRIETQNASRTIARRAFADPVVVNALMDEVQRLRLSLLRGGSAPRRSRGAERLPRAAATSADTRLSTAR